jgi:hypothetical protein
MAAYQHSNAFAALKDIKEDLHENLSTYQYLDVLDFFLESSLDPLATAVPDFMDNFFAAVVAWQAHKPSVKFSRDNKYTMPVKFFNSVTTEGKTKRLHQRSMLLNRGLLFGMLAMFSNLTKSYLKLHDATRHYKRTQRLQLIKKVESSLNATHLHSACIQHAWYAQKAYTFKELITQKYTRLAIMNAKRAYTSLNCEVSLDDIVQTYLLYLNKAIDRCDSRQGVLTTFIQNWFYSARAEIIKNTEENRHTSYEDFLDKLPVKHTEATNPYEAVQHISYQAKQIDEYGVVRYALKIPEFFSYQQLKKLRLFTTTNERSH